MKNTAGNANYSLLSLYFALALSCSGADGTTQNELPGLLGTSVKAGLSQQCGNLFRILYTDNEITKLKIANSVWMDSEIDGLPYSYKESFTGNASANFYASLFDVDFSDAKTRTVMGKWIANNTNRTLTPDIKVSESQVLSLINTVYFYKELGIHSAFDEMADFSGITDSYAYISGVTQNTYIAIDENSVEASAFSQIQ